MLNYANLCDLILFSNNTEVIYNLSIASQDFAGAVLRDIKPIIKQRNSIRSTQSSDFIINEFQRLDFENKYREYVYTALHTIPYYKTLIATKDGDILSLYKDRDQITRMRCITNVKSGSRICSMAHKGFDADIRIFVLCDDGYLYYFLEEEGIFDKWRKITTEEVLTRSVDGINLQSSFPIPNGF